MRSISAILSYYVPDLFKAFNFITGGGVGGSGLPNFKKTIKKSYFLNGLIKTFNLIPNMAINTG